MNTRGLFFLILVYFLFLRLLFLTELSVCLFEVLIEFDQLVHLLVINFHSFQDLSILFVKLIKVFLRLDFFSLILLNLHFEIFEILIFTGNFLLDGVDLLSQLVLEVCDFLILLLPELLLFFFEIGFEGLYFLLQFLDILLILVNNLLLSLVS